MGHWKHGSLQGWLPAEVGRRCRIVTCNFCIWVPTDRQSTAPTLAQRTRPGCRADVCRGSRHSTSHCCYDHGTGTPSLDPKPGLVCTSTFEHFSHHLIVGSLRVLQNSLGTYAEGDGGIYLPTYGCLLAALAAGGWAEGPQSITWLWTLTLYKTRGRGSFRES